MKIDKLLELFNKNLNNKLYSNGLIYNLYDVGVFAYEFEWEIIDDKAILRGYRTKNGRFINDFGKTIMNKKDVEVSNLVWYRSSKFKNDCS